MKKKSKINSDNLPDLKQILMSKDDVMNNNINVQEQGKTISINMLPDCSHKKLLIDLVTDQAAKICVAACINSTDRTWQAYAGYPDVRDLKPVPPTDYHFDIQWCCENVRDRANVLFMGEKLNKETAEILFPDWKDKTYKE